MSIIKSLGYLYQLPTALLGTEINGSTYGNRSHLPCFFHRTKHHLIIRIGIA